MIILTVSIIVSTSPSGFMLDMSQLCLRNMSWLPGKAAHVCPRSLVLLKKSYAAQSMSMSRLWRSWNRSPRIMIFSISCLWQYFLTVLRAHMMSF